MPHDLDKYRPFLKGEHLTEEQEDHFIHTLYTALEKLADRQFGMDAVNLTKEANALTESYDRVSMRACSDPAQSDE